MKFEAWPVEPPGFGSGPLSIWTMSVQPRRLRWPTRQLPTMPAPMITQFACAGTVWPAVWPAWPAVSWSPAWLIDVSSTLELSPTGDISFRYHEPITERAGVSRDPADDRDAGARPGRGGARGPLAAPVGPGPHADPRGAATFGARPVRHHHPPTRHVRVEHRRIGVVDAVRDSGDPRAVCHAPGLRSRSGCRLGRHGGGTCPRDFGQFADATVGGRP